VTGSDFKKIRQANGLTQIQMAQVLGIERIAISRFETGTWDIPWSVEALVVYENLPTIIDIWIQKQKGKEQIKIHRRQARHKSKK
jgi:transcriptional regulator with XRE-family HTH domain